MNQAVNINITTSSEVIYFSTPFPPATVPTITINGVAVPAPSQAPFTPTGYQVLVFDATKSLTDPSALIANQYACVNTSGNNGSWMGTYQSCYDEIYTILLNAGNIDQQIRIIVSFGLDQNMPPTNHAFDLMLQTGGDGQLQYWEQNCDAGSQSSFPTSWVSIPVSYILFGGSGWGYGQGFEAYVATAGTATLAVSMPS